jgi:hypothetical protein
MLIYKEEEPKICVRGGKGTSGIECEVCDGWLNHWKKFNGLKKDEKVNCCHPDHKKTGNKIADRGAHVVKLNSLENKTNIKLSPTDISDIINKKLFIIPVCEKHNITENENIIIPKNLLVVAKPCKREKGVRLGIRRN